MKHDKIIDDIVDRLHQNHPEAEIESCREFFYNGKEGECDICMAEDNLLYVIEVKSKDTNKSRKKAKKQLKKDIGYYTTQDYFSEIYGFYAHTAKDKPRGYDVKKIYKIKK